MHVLTGPRPLTVGSRAGRLRASHSYGIVLALIILSFALAVLLPDDAWTAAVLLCAYAATFATALWTSGVTGVASRTTLAVGVFAALVAIAPLTSGGERVYALVALVTGGLIVGTIAVIALGVMDQRAVNAQSVRGAICVYVLLGLLFVFLYGAAAALGDGPFFAQGYDGSRADRVYFSFVTLATLGYGDLTPAGDFGRLLAIAEALIGQLYLVTVVALLMSRIGLVRHTDRAEDASSREDDDAPASGG